MLLLLTVVADVMSLPLHRVSELLYGVAMGSYVVVIVLGVLLRSPGISKLVLAAVYLAADVMLAFAVVQATGVVHSAFTFLYLLAILDAAIIASRPATMSVATAATLAFGGQLAFQVYGVGGKAAGKGDAAFLISLLTHLVAFYLVALLASYFGDLLRRAREAATVAESDLLHAHELHEAILESLPLGVLTVDQARHVRTANLGAARILGAAIHDLVGKPLPAALHLAIESATEHPVVATQLNGVTRHLSFARASLAKQGDAPLEVVVMEDRTELRELEQSLAVRARLASIGELAAAIAHEVRNPLASISGAVELMQGCGDNVDERDRLSGIVLREISRLNRLVDEFLLYARPGAADRLSVDLAALSRELVEMLRSHPLAQERTIRMQTPERLMASVDAQQIQQVLWNLLRNALEATPKGSQVEFLVREQEGEQRCVVFEVRDHGAGIASQVQSRLFEPFQTTKPDGTGLGLAVVHRIVEKHEGVVTLENVADGGARALVILPA